MQQQETALEIHFVYYVQWCIAIKKFLKLDNTVVAVSMCCGRK